MNAKDTTTWNASVDTLASMCLAEKLGRGGDKEAFILTLRLYAGEMEKLIRPAEPEVSHKKEGSNED